MHIDLLDSLARIRIDQLTREAAAHRALAAVRPRPNPLRRGLARLVRALGHAALSLGDAIASTR
ncbi:MAG: hypothetical protein NVSMB19_13630 [Vulcanimicrobiaceae bacterium]